MTFYDLSLTIRIRWNINQVRFRNYGSSVTYTTSKTTNIYLNYTILHSFLPITWRHFLHLIILYKSCRHSHPFCCRMCAMGWNKVHTCLTADLLYSNAGKSSVLTDIMCSNLFLLFPCKCDSQLVSSAVEKNKKRSSNCYPHPQSQRIVGDKKDKSSFFV